MPSMQADVQKPMPSNRTVRTALNIIDVKNYYAVLCRFSEWR